MPWHAARSEECPTSRPWAVILDATGEVVACHPTEESANRQVAALYAREGASEEPAAKRGSELRRKAVELIDTKADAATGEVVAVASVFNNVDRVGDRMLPGSFTKTLRRWRELGDPIPIILSHQWDDLFAHIGAAAPADVKQTPRGLIVKGVLDVEENPLARQAHKLMRERRLKGWSFGYTVPEGGEEVDEKGVNEVSEVDLVEVGPTLVGANPEAQLQTVKAWLSDEEARGELGTGRFSVAVARHLELTPRSEDELRRRSAELELGKAERPEPPLAPEAPDPIPGPEPPPEVEPPEEPRSEDELRRRSAELALEGEKANAIERTERVDEPGRPEPEEGPLPERPEGHPVPGESGADSPPAEAVRERAAVAKGVLDLVTGESPAPEPPPDPEPPEKPPYVEDPVEPPVEPVEEKAWDGSPSRFTDEQYAASAILDRADCGAEWRALPAKTRYSLPIKDPGASRPNPDALGPAAAALAGARGGVSACPAAISAAKRRLRAAYATLGLEAPEGLQSLSPASSDRAVEDGERSPAPPPDPLRRRSLAAVLDVRTGGTRPQSTDELDEPPAYEPPDEGELRRRSRDLELDL